MKSFLSFFVFIISVFLISCGPTVRLNRENLSNQFNADALKFNPEFVVFNFSNDSSRIYFRINTKELLFKNNGDSFAAGIKIHYDLFPSYNSTSVLDSGTNEVLAFSADQNFITGQINFRQQNGRDAVLKILVKDINRNTEALRIIKSGKTNSSQRQNFTITDSEGNILFRNHISAPESFKIICRDSSVKSFLVRCYFRKFPMAIPPFKEGQEQFFDYRADSIFKISVDSVSALRLNRYGFYHFQTDSAVKDGITVYRYGEGFPEIKLADQLVDPTRYLTSNNEFQEIFTAKDKKAAIDRFWLTLGGNQERTRTLIKIYYSRVQDANRHFTSYTEGWRTDRGMMYIIFGAPETVYSDDHTEIWLYNSGVSSPDISFAFKKIKNPFSENDYSLIREREFEGRWYSIVEQWREGRVIN